MKLKLLICIPILVILLSIMFSFLFTHPKNKETPKPEQFKVDEKVLQHTIEKRKEYGFSTNEEKVKKVIQKGNYSSKWGFYMNKEEEADLENRAGTQEQKKSIVEQFLTENDEVKKDYKDMYWDQAHGGTLVLLFRVNTVQDHIEALKKLKRSIPNIRFDEAKYNEYELSMMLAPLSKPEVRDKIFSKNIQLVGCYPDLLKQKIVIEVEAPSKSKEVEKEIISEILHVDKSLIIIEKGAILVPF